MLRAAILFFVLGLLAMAMGAYNVAGVSLDVGKLLLIGFAILAGLSLIVGLFNGRSPRVLP